MVWYKCLVGNEVPTRVFCSVMQCSDTNGALIQPYVRMLS